MHAGKLLEINITSTKGNALHSMKQVIVKADFGIEGDRYFKKEGTIKDKIGKPRDITLIEIEALQALERDYGLLISAAETRRNLLTINVPLNHYVNKLFKVGEVLMKGIELCEPCGYLEKLTAKPLKAALIHRGGLRAQIISDGQLCIGDLVIGV
jgi:MOSC domain-containing protein YiiM